MELLLKHFLRNLKQSMEYKIELQEQAKDDIRAIYQYVSGYSYVLAEKWYQAIKLEIASLKTMPYRYALSHEAKTLQHELRQIVFGKNTACYSIIYRVIEDSKEIRVLTIRHASRKPIEIEDFTL